MKKLFIIFFLSITTTIFSQGNFNTEWESPTGLTFKQTAKLNQSSNILYIIFTETGNEHSIKIYNGFTHTQYYDWTATFSFSFFDVSTITGMSIGSNMFETGNDVFQTGAFDVNSDGFNDIIQTTPDSTFIRNPIFTGSILYATHNQILQAVDIDDDGYVELIERTGSGTIKIISTPAQTHPVSVNNQNEIVKDYDLKQNYLNPFNPNTTIEYDLNKNAEVKITIYDILGKEIQTLVNQKQPSGSYKLNLQGQNLSSGTYFYSLSVDGIA